MTPVDEPNPVECYEHDHGIHVITICSQPLGVLNFPVKTALLELLTTREFRACVITGAAKAFSVGSDIREFEQEPTKRQKSIQLDQELNNAIEDARYPVIAACNGLTLGGGAELILACDLRIAARSATFGFPEVLVGAMPSAGAVFRLPQVVGRGHAMDLLLSGRQVSSDEALHMGLVNRVVDDSEIISASVQVARELTHGSALALAATKYSVVQSVRHGAVRGATVERYAATVVESQQDAGEGQAAFLEHRSPQFTSTLADLDAVLSAVPPPRAESPHD